MALTASDVEAVLGPTDESMVAQIIATGANGRRSSRGLGLDK